MAGPITNRNDFKTYCLRRLGFPVIEINVDDDQVEDRIDDALQYWQDYHFDGLQKYYFVKIINSSSINTNITINTNLFASNPIITGNTSGAQAGVVGYNGTSNTQLIVNISDQGKTPFIVGETLNYTAANGQSYSTGATVVSSILGDVDARYLDFSKVTDFQGNPMDIVGVSRIFPIGDSQSNVNMFDLRYQLRLNELYDFTSASYVNYTLTQQHLRSLEQMFTGESPIRFQRHMKRLFIDWNWGNEQAPVGQAIICETYASINPNIYGDVYNDRWLKEYTTALIKRSWGNNLKKFAGLQLPGSVTLNGDKIYQEAIDEIEKLEKEMETNFGAPLEFMMN
jgi:hypothetical protein